MKKIILLLLAGIGDSLLFVPALRALRSTYPQAHITVLVREKPTQAIFERYKEVNEVLFYPFLREGYFSSLRYIFGLRRNHYDLSILAYPANRFQTNLISFLIGAKERLAHLYTLHRFRSLSFLNTRRLPLDHHRHTIEENLELLTLLGVSVSHIPKTFDLPLTPSEKGHAARLFKEYSLRKNDFIVGVHAGSSILGGMENKRWPKEKFATLLNLLIEKKKAKIILFGSKQELTLNQSLQRLITSAIILDPELPLLSVLAFVRYCHLFVTNDSLFMHIAAHYTIPTVVVSAHLNPYKYRPLHASVAYLTPPQSCTFYQVGKNLTCLYKGTSRHCLNQISVDQVYNAIEELLS